MNLNDLQEYLSHKPIHPDAVSFGTGLPFEFEKYCIVKEDEIWEVYYSERGHKVGLTQFKNEIEACQYFLELLEADQSVWRLL